MVATRVPTVVVGYDGSKHAERALQWAVDEARRRGATLRVVYAWEPPFVEGYPYAPNTAHEPERIEAHARELVDKAVAAALGTETTPTVDRIIVCGSPASTLLDRSRGADLIVVGSRGLGGFRGLLLGSVSHQVAHHARVPVVIVHDGNDGDR